MATTVHPTPHEAHPGEGASVDLTYCVSHAPQIFLQPAEEDPAELATVHEGYRRFARQAKELELDALLVVALDHLHNHFLDLVPMFTVFTGTPVVARMNAVDAICEARPDLADSLIDHLLASDFDPAFSQREVLDHSFFVPLHFASTELETPVMPIVINAYVPPQPSMRRCYAFGRAIAKWSHLNDYRIGVVATGGMSHYPGTDRFHHPDLAADQEVLGWLKAGDIDRLINLSAAELDRIGMVELRTWAVALGARGGAARLRYNTYWDSGHCGYAILEF